MVLNTYVHSTLQLQYPLNEPKNRSPWPVHPRVKIPLVSSSRATLDHKHAQLVLLWNGTIHSNFQCQHLTPCLNLNVLHQVTFVMTDSETIHTTTGSRYCCVIVSGKNSSV